MGGERRATEGCGVKSEVVVEAAARRSRALPAGDAHERESGEGQHAGPMGQGGHYMDRDDLAPRANAQMQEVGHIHRPRP